MVAKTVTLVEREKAALFTLFNVYVGFIYKLYMYIMHGQIERYFISERFGFNENKGHFLDSGYARTESTQNITILLSLLL